MNRSFSKIRHIQEANVKLEKRMLGEQFIGGLDKNKSTFTPIDFDVEIKNTKKRQLKDIIDNFEKINCDGINMMSAESLYGQRPERDIIYCTAYNGKSKEDMIDILNKQ